MSTNIIKSGSLDTLKTGETLLVQARKTNGESNKVQLEWAEKIAATTVGRRKMRAIQLLNSSDPSFSSGAQRSWTAVTVADAKKFLGINLSDANDAWYLSESRAGEQVEVMDLDILNPCTVDSDKALSFKMEIWETVEPTEWQKLNAETACKRAGKNGDTITHEGQLIFRNTDMIIVDPNDDSTKAEHIFLVPDARNVELADLEGDTLDFEEVSMLDAEVVEG